MNVDTVHCQHLPLYLFAARLGQKHVLANARHHRDVKWFWFDGEQGDAVADEEDSHKSTASTGGSIFVPRSRTRNKG